MPEFMENLHLNEKSIMLLYCMYIVLVKLYIFAFYTFYRNNGVHNSCYSSQTSNRIYVFMCVYYLCYFKNGKKNFFFLKIFPHTMYLPGQKNK